MSETSKSGGNSDLIPADDYYLVIGLSGLLFSSKYYSEAEHIYARLPESDRKRVAAFIPLTHDIKWSSKLMGVKAYVDRYISLPTIKDDDASVRSIARWLSNQRVRLTDDDSSLERIAVLNELVPTWNPERDRWDRKFAEVVNFYAVHGRLPHSTEENGSWLGTQRADSKKNALRDDRRFRLDRSLPEWGGLSDDEKWKRKLETLTSFIKQHERLPRRGNDGESTVANWLGTQTGLVNKELLGDEKTKLLTDELLTVVTPDMRRSDLPEFLGVDQWSETLKQVVGYVDAHGEMPRASGGKLASSLSGWMTRQRQRSEDGLTQDQTEALDASLPDWRVTIETRWAQNLNRCVAYFESRHSFPTTSSDDPEIRSLGHWFQNQKTALKSGGDPEREAEFDERLPGWREGIEVIRTEEWDATLESVLAFIAAHAKYPSLRTKYPLEKSLAGWVYKQRDRSKDDRMTDAQRSTLDSRLPLWAGRQEAGWDKQFNAAVDYYVRFGILPRKKNGEFAGASTWLRSQRSQNRKGAVKAHRVAALNSALPGWSEDH